MKNNNQDAVSGAFNHSRRAERSIDELIGLCKGIVADGHVSESEAKYLLNWLETNRDAIDLWPANVIYPRLIEIFEDGIMDDDEERDLLKMLMDLGARPKMISAAASASNFLPLCDPAPDIEHAGKVFVLTGTFCSGKRSEVSEKIESRGGIVGKRITHDTNYLVIGEIGSRDWIHSTHGRKIEQAVKLRDEGQKLNIISEEHWFHSIS